ncbi:DNA glycosylase AlkZ-like family protein [Zhihengliuella sp.]|uniref:DNA glycosylase AlkZ-like family protein n=1 Tax=Zhihengliuella sp. TaxID=1954483 RepID=UPI0035BFE63A
MDGAGDRRSLGRSAGVAQRPRAARFDEFLLGYADRGAVLAPEHAHRVVPGNNGVFRPTVVVGGAVVGCWSATASARRGGVPAPEFFGPAPGPRAVAAFAARVGEYRRFRGH